MMFDLISQFADQIEKTRISRAYLPFPTPSTFLVPPGRGPRTGFEKYKFFAPSSKSSPFSFSGPILIAQRDLRGTRCASLGVARSSQGLPQRVFRDVGKVGRYLQIVSRIPAASFQSIRNVFSGADHEGLEIPEIKFWGKKE